MHRILADVTSDQLRSLEQLARQQAISRAEVIRRAIASYVSENRPSSASFFGAWKRADGEHVAEAEDGLAFQDRLRSEW